MKQKANSLKRSTKLTNFWLDLKKKENTHITKIGSERRNITNKCKRILSTFLCQQMR